MRFKQWLERRRVPANDCLRADDIPDVWSFDGLYLWLQSIDANPEKMQAALDLWNRWAKHCGQPIVAAPWLIERINGNAERR
jgi:hypothetical protein